MVVVMTVGKDNLPDSLLGREEHLDNTHRRYHVLNIVMVVVVVILVVVAAGKTVFH